MDSHLSVSRATGHLLFAADIDSTESYRPVRDSNYAAPGGSLYVSVLYSVHTDFFQTTGDG